MSVLCPTCVRRTKNEVLHESKTTQYDEEGYGVGFYDSYQIIRCMGCETISFRHASWSDIDEDPATGEPVISEEIYPHRLAGRKKMDGTERLPLKVRKVYEETLNSLAAGGPILGTIGIRAVVEAVCKDKQAAGATLEQRIDDLVAKGLLSPQQADFLHESRVLGNVAVHEIEPAEPHTLKIAMDIIENLLQTVYILPAALEGRKTQ